MVSGEWVMTWKETAVVRFKALTLHLRRVSEEKMWIVCIGDNPAEILTKYRPKALPYTSLEGGVLCLPSHWQKNLNIESCKDCNFTKFVMGFLCCFAP